MKEACGYHLQCYRNFTEISKLDRAKTMIANSSTKRPAEDNSEEIDEASHQHQAKYSRPKRHCLLKEGTTPGRTSSNILPQFARSVNVLALYTSQMRSTNFTFAFCTKIDLNLCGNIIVVKNYCCQGRTERREGEGCDTSTFLKIVGNL